MAKNGDLPQICPAEIMQFFASQIVCYGLLEASACVPLVNEINKLLSTFRRKPIFDDMGAHSALLALWTVNPQVITGGIPIQMTGDTMFGDFFVSRSIRCRLNSSDCLIFELFLDSAGLCIAFK